MSNVFNQELRRTIEEKEKPITDTRICICNNEDRRVPVGQPCPVCDKPIPPEPIPIGMKFCKCTNRNIPINVVCPTCPDPTPTGNNLVTGGKLEQIAIGALILAAILPRGDKK